MQGCQRGTRGWPPGNIISVACHLGEVHPPSLVQLGKPFQALVTICNLYTLEWSRRSGGLSGLAAQDLQSSTKAGPGITQEGVRPGAWSRSLSFVLGMPSSS